MKILKQRFIKKPGSNLNFHDKPIEVLWRIKNDKYGKKWNGKYEVESNYPILNLGSISHYMLKKHFQGI